MHNHVSIILCDTCRITACTIDFFSSLNNDTEFYNGDCMLSVYKWSRSREYYPLDTLAKLLITDTVPSSNVCSKQPLQICRNVSFVVDLNMLDDPLDIRADEMGYGSERVHLLCTSVCILTKEKQDFFDEPRHQHDLITTKSLECTIIMLLPLTSLE